MKKRIISLFKTHELPEVNSIKQIKEAKINSVFIINAEYIIKFAKYSNRGFEKDHFAYKTFNNLPLAKEIIYDDSKKLVDCEYIIQAKLPGTNLSKLWISMSTIEQKGIFKQIIDILKVFHSYTFKSYGDYVIQNMSYAKWEEYFTKHFQDSLRIAMSTKLINEKLREKILLFYKDNKSVLNERKLNPSYCHNDLHFSNILVENNKITGILDFDLSLAAPFDFEFEILLSFFKQPEFFIESSLKSQYKKPLNNCIHWLHIYYPELYEIPNINIRMCIYALAGSLQMLWLCGRFNYGDDQKNKLIQKIHEILESKYTF